MTPMVSRGPSDLPASLPLGLPGGGGSRALSPVARYVGTASLFIGLAGFAPLAVLWLHPDEVPLAPCFIFPSLAAMALGYLLRFASAWPARAVPLSRRQAAVCTLLIWVIAVVVYAAPFVVAGLLTPVQAVFEATSGLTTTGLSVVDVATCPAVFLFHRSLTCYLGGVGLVLILTCVVTGTGGLGVYNAEGHTDRLLPSSAKTARLILLIYTGIIAVGAVAYVIAGMTPFDAVNISMCAVSTAGFATHPESLAFWQSPAIELVTVVLMIAGGMNFLLLFLLMRGKFKAFATHIETPLYFGIIAVGTLVVGGLFWARGISDGAGDALRDGLFQVVSVLTSTGFQTVPSFAAMGPALLFLFMLLMFSGAEARSTSGGIKIYRVAVASLGLAQTLRSRYGSKRHITSVKINRFGKRTVLTADDVAEARAFVALYFLVFAVGTFLFILCGATLQEAAFDFASCLGNTGVGTGFLGPDSGAAALIIGSVGMLLGRLEIIPLFMGAGALLSFLLGGVRHGR
ncbi:TrkH family potassium uptake protein [Adlercreutzia faecimuris]|uniref:TrkH family potassium uptake protein n=1 Tax=Adlercreutzia faecimuris TaxID=2897341 RepID=A0ABS9WGY4_9ACTN|nr:TrkH family potassium uptake protein [Adlercreutzia sp. JBNU-10]MCI2242127.1 TrkH family potassium uptake protein [Adlercreutzia sp. JBNU-10]